MTTRIAISDRRLLPEGRLSGPMPWVIAIMMFLTVLAAIAGLSLGAATQGLSASLAGRLTVQIVEANPDKRAAQRSDALIELRKVDGVIAVDPVDDAAMRQLLSPWLGSEGLDADLPVPTLIDVTLREASPRAVDRVKTMLRRVAPAARVDRHADWLGPLAGLLSTLRLVAMTLVMLMAIAMGASVVLSARAALDMHRPTIDVMHLMGATDAQIARLFERRVALDALFGSAVGFVFGVIVTLLLAQRFDDIGAALLESGGLGWTDWLIIAAVPVAGVLLAIVTARITVTRALARIL